VSLPVGNACLNLVKADKTITKRDGRAAVVAVQSAASPLTCTPPQCRSLPCLGPYSSSSILQHSACWPTSSAVRSNGEFVCLVRYDPTKQVSGLTNHSCSAPCRLAAKNTLRCLTRPLYTPPSLSSSSIRRCLIDTVLPCVACTPPNGCQSST
jgi:hypothetical protein